ncbi:hypothetical protein SPHINGOAX6_70887 [Sphingomonas sp. AX6]|nr:hypothetical protein SPHINGOAX6_70887 [Sphingomonas sp. AX6]
MNARGQAWRAAVVKGFDGELRNHPIRHSRVGGNPLALSQVMDTRLRGNADQAGPPDVITP